MRNIKLFSLLFFASLLIGVTSCKKKDKVIDTPSKYIYNEPYGADPAQDMVVHLPVNRSIDSTKVAILIHGGSWMSGDKNEMSGMVDALKKELPNYAIIAINYRLFNSTTTPSTNLFPTQELDVEQAIEYILTKRNDWQISDKFVLVGVSAGAHLALLHAYKNNSTHLVKAVAAYFPPSDLVTFYNANAYAQSVLDSVIGGNPTDSLALYKSSSPINYTSTAIPTILFHGANDNIVPIQQSTVLKDSLVAKNKIIDYQIIPVQGHGFTASKTVETIKNYAIFFKTYNP